MHALYMHRGDEALSNCPAPADTSEQSASKADPAIDGNSSESSDRNKVLLALTLPNCAIMSGSLSQSVMKRSCWVSLNIQNTFQSTRLAPSFQLQCLGTLAEMANHACIRDYLSWSKQLQALFCFPCRLFSTNDSLIKSSLASPRGWSANCGPKWKKLYDRLTEHENSASHQQRYLSWRDVHATKSDK